MSGTASEHEQLGPMHPSHAESHRTWSGLLTTANAAAVRDRMVRDFAGRRLTIVVANGFFGFKPEVHPSCQLDRRGFKDLIRLNTDPMSDGRPWAHLMWSADDYSWGFHSSATDQRSARQQDVKSAVSLTFETRRGLPQLTVDQYTPAGDRLFWTIIAEAPADTDRGGA